MEFAQATERLQPSYIREILAAATSPEVISLAGGLPAEESFPMGLLAPGIEALGRDPGLFQYGSSRGYEPLLEALRESMALDSGQDLLVCNGSQQALDLAARTFLDPGDCIVVEAPAYLGALQVFQIAAAEILTVSQTAEGPELDELSTLFASHRVKLFYAVPDFHNPTGVCWSTRARRKVAALCRAHDVALVEDSPYRDIRFAGRALPRVSQLMPENALLLRSFSKTVAPGMRLGIASGPRRWIDRMLRVKQAADLHSPVPTQVMLHAVISAPAYSDHVETVCRIYGDRYRALSDAIRRHLDGAAFHDPVKGGMFIWVRLEGVDTSALAASALRAGVAVVPGAVFYPGSRLTSEFMRVNFTHSTAHRLDHAVGLLADSLMNLKS